jgi:flagellar secretion chaperone FliS
MNPYAAYRQQETVGWTRIDMLLALYDGAIERLEKARLATEQKQDAIAREQTLKAQLIVGELALGLRPVGGESLENFQRLYEFVLYCLNLGTPEKLEAALRVLRILREGFEGIRAEALRLERTGQIPSIDAVRSLQATA